MLNAFCIPRSELRCADSNPSSQVLGVKDVTCHFKRVNLVAGGEGKGIVTHGVPLVVVADGIAEVDGVGGVLLERILQVDDDALASGLYFGHL